MYRDDIKKIQNLAAAPILPPKLISSMIDELSASITDAEMAERRGLEIRHHQSRHNLFRIFETRTITYYAVPMWFRDADYKSVLRFLRKYYLIYLEKYYRIARPIDTLEHPELLMAESLASKIGLRPNSLGDIVDALVRTNIELNAFDLDRLCPSETFRTALHFIDLCVSLGIPITLYDAKAEICPRSNILAYLSDNMNCIVCAIPEAFTSDPMRIKEILQFYITHNNQIRSMSSTTISLDYDELPPRDVIERALLMLRFFRLLGIECSVSGGTEIAITVKSYDVRKSSASLPSDIDSVISEIESIIDEYDIIMMFRMFNMEVM